MGFRVACGFCLSLEALGLRVWGFGMRDWCFKGLVFFLYNFGVSMGDIYGIELDLLTWYCGFESLIIVMFFVFFEHTHTHMQT